MDQSDWSCYWTHFIPCDLNNITICWTSDTLILMSWKQGLQTKTPDKFKLYRVLDLMKDQGKNTFIIGATECVHCNKETDESIRNPVVFLQLINQLCDTCFCPGLTFISTTKWNFFLPGESSPMGQNGSCLLWSKKVLMHSVAYITWLYLPILYSFNWILFLGSRNLL